MKKEQKKLIIIDSNALIHRAFHALPPLSNKKGVPTNAAYGFTMILIKAIKDLQPDYVVATFDRKEKTFRHEDYEEYKANRIKQPDELYEQIPITQQILKSFNIKVFELAGYEADDLIGTITRDKLVNTDNIETIIITGDQDTLQLVNKDTKVLSPHKGLGETIIYDEKAVEEKFDGLKPEQLIDYKALRGDPSDNIPGVKGIGQKGAIDLLKNFNDLEGIYKNIESKKIKDRTRELLKTQKAGALMSQKLATISLDAPIKFKLEECEFKSINTTEVVKIFQELNFNRLLPQINSLDKVTTEEKAKQSDKPKQGSQKYQLIQNKKEATSLVKKLGAAKEFCFDTETDGLNPFDSSLIGISFCWENNEAYYLPQKHISGVEPELKKIFSNPKIKKIGHNLKFDIEVLQEAGLNVEGAWFDTMIASYLINSDHRQHNLNNLAFAELGYQMQPIENLIGKGKGQKSLINVDIEKVSWYSCEDADITWQLYQKLKKELEAEGMFGLLEEMEMPLVQVLAKIEKNGVKIDATILKKQSTELEKKLKSLEKKIFKIAECEFNISSPIQLKEVLFEKMKISTTGLKKTKTGISTAAPELEKIKNENEIVKKILEFRELAKLKSTYTDALPKLINKKDGRVHTSFNQTITATGRLSSSDPNLQNIPIRTETGGPIRQAFIAEPGFKILKADYSQIELRIVASLANDPKMIKTFKNGEDIHTDTAAEINGIEKKDVTPQQRRQAKEVNFGVLYGMGAWGLSQRTGLPAEEAKYFIDKYFSVYKKVKDYLEETIEAAKEKGYVETFYGRRRYLPDINSGMRQVQSAAERMAVNMPIQGTAADIIKLAMIQIDRDLHTVSPKTKMILQVHDELVFEVPEKEIKKTAEFIKEKMNNIFKLRAPIETEIKYGNNWGQTEAVSTN